jgi:large subunit ribosomal protein L9
MKVILLTDVKGRGKEGDVIEVARGFAANYLLPRKMAVEATSGNLKQLEARMHNIQKREEAKRAEAEGLAAQVSGKALTVEAKAGEGGKLFGSVTAGMVADALAEQLGVEVDRKKLDLHGHIKTVGEHTIGVRIYQDVTAEIVVNVVPLGGELLPAPVPAAPAAPAAVAETDAPVETETADEVADEATAGEDYGDEAPADADDETAESFDTDEGDEDE